MLDERFLWDLASNSDAVAHIHVAQYFEDVKNSEYGWRDCINLVISKRYSHVGQIQFFCLQVLEHYVRTRHATASAEDQYHLRAFLTGWVEIQSIYDGTKHQEAFILNKAAQVSALAFVRDYPAKWPEYFAEHIVMARRCPQNMEHYLRVLLAIDAEVADEKVPRCPEELQRNTVIKDAMRENAVFQLVESWYKLLTGLNGQYPHLSRLCLQVIGKYTQWIDINLVANDRFVAVLRAAFDDPETGVCAAECIEEIISTWMEPFDKAILVERFYRVLKPILVEFGARGDLEYQEALGNLFCTMGTNLIESHDRLTRSVIPIAIEEVKFISDAIEEKIPLLHKMLGSILQEISMSVFDFMKDYVHMIKSLFKPIGRMSESQIKNYKLTLDVVIRKLVLDIDYDIDIEGEFEAEFCEYRKQLKVIFDNLVQLDKVYVMTEVQARIFDIGDPRIHGNHALDTEVALLMLYYLGEHVPSVSPGPPPDLKDDEGPPSIERMMHRLLELQVYKIDHPAVALQFFEVIVRYEKFFVGELKYITEALDAFLNDKGLFNPNKKVRSRTCYLFSRFVKCVRRGIAETSMQMIVDRINPLLTLQKDAMPKDDYDDCLITCDDQLYLYEIIGVLIVSTGCENQKKVAFLDKIVKMILAPCREGVSKLLTPGVDPKQQEIAVELLVQAIAVTGKLSKAFSTTTTMKSLGCVQIFLDPLGVFLQMLQLPIEESLTAQLQSSIRQYLHRLVVCLEEELLPYIPTASKGLLRNCDGGSIQEYIPLIVQVINKYKKDVVPFLKQMFTPVAQGVFLALSVPTELNDEQDFREKQLLRRQYIIFVSTIVANNLTDVLSAQSELVVYQVMKIVVDGTDTIDPMIQMVCFVILRMFVELWHVERPPGFTDFLYKYIVPACFIAPIQETFDISDAQTLICLNEISLCLRTVFDKSKKEFVAYLMGYLPRLQVPLHKVQEFVTILQTDNKQFKKHFKAFVSFLRSVNYLDN